MGWLQPLAAAVAVAVGIATMWRWALRPLQREVARLAHRVRALEEVTEQMGGQVRGVTQALVPVLAERYAGNSRAVADLLASFNGTWDRVAGWEEQQRNPLTDAELARFLAYRARIFADRRTLSPEQCADLEALLEKMDQDRPRPPGLGALFVLSAILRTLAQEPDGALAPGAEDRGTHL